MNEQIVIAQALEDAADFILMRGLHRGDLRSLDDQYCTIGAIYQVSSREAVAVGYPVPGEAVRTLEQYLRSQGVPLHPSREGEVHPVAVWSDNSTDDFEVIDALQHCAKDIRNTATLEQVS